MPSGYSSDMDVQTHIDIHTPYDAADIALAKQIYDILWEIYPGHPWAISANHRQGNGTADIRLLYPNKEGQIYQFGFKLHIGKLDASRIRKKAMIAGGELLERYGLRRGGANQHSALDARDNGLDRSGAIK